MKITLTDRDGNTLPPEPSRIDVAADAAREVAEIIDPMQPDTIAATLIREHDRAVLEGPSQWTWARLAGDIIPELANETGLPTTQADVWGSIILSGLAHYGMDITREDVISVAIEAVSRYRIRKEMESWGTTEERPCGS